MNARMSAWLSQKLRKKYNNYLSAKKIPGLISQLQNALRLCPDVVPIFIVSYNNGTYVHNTVRQLAGFGYTPIVLDNNSTDAVTLDILKRLSDYQSAQIVFCGWNFGHMVGFLGQIYPLLPEVFAYTDPDLEFSQTLPANFISVLAELTHQYSVFKAGFALKLLEGEVMTKNTFHFSINSPFPFQQDFTVQEWESQYWTKPLMHDSLEVYSALVDTTFAVYRKSNYKGLFTEAVRVAGDYAAIHLPWFPELDPMSKQERNNYSIGNKSSTWIQI